MTIEEFERDISVLRPRLMQVGRSFFRDDSDAEDATQDALLRLWTVRHRLTAPYEPLALRIARNCCVDLWRSRQGQATIVPMAEATSEPSDSRTPLMQMEEQERLRMIRQCIRRMPERQRRICEIYYDEGLTTSDIARIVGIKVHSVQTILSAARQQIIQSLQKQKAL